VYEFLRKHRAHKGHQLSMSWNMLKDMLKHHKDHYLFCTVRLQEQVIAAAIMVQVSPSVLYYYIPGHDMAYNSLSPMVYLLAELYGWALAHEVNHIDLGTSYWGNQKNESLVAFKRRLSGQASSGSVLRKALSS